MKVQFKHPPINELIIGAYFDPPLSTLRSEHIGLLWSKFREEFPKVEQKEPMVIRPPAPSDEFFLMPRFWFVSEDETYLIQVQKDAFLLNWRKRESDYPHFNEQLKPSFDRYFAVFEEFLQKDVGWESGLRINHCELTYVDLIEPCDYWRSPQDTPKLIPSFTMPKWWHNCDTEPSFSCVYRYALESDLQLTITLRTAETVTEPNEPRLIIEFKAIGILGGVSKSHTDAWYVKAHDIILNSFLEATNKEVQQNLWIPEERFE